MSLLAFLLSRISITVGKSKMQAGLYSNNNFCKVLCKLLEKAGISCYQIYQYTNINEGYFSRLKSGERFNPSVETIMRISLALASLSNGKTKQHHVEELFNSVGRSLFRKRDHKDVWDE
jgi:transcriptional regulator with XRE-family HTH domain